MTDYKQLCAEFVSAVDGLLSPGESPANPGQRLILTVHVEDLGALADRARAALAEPDLKTPTDKELTELYRKSYYECENRQGDAAQVFALRAVLARWGNRPGSPDSSPPLP